MTNINITAATPLGLRSAGYSEAAKAAQGFGAMTEAGVQRIQNNFTALVKSLLVEGEAASAVADAAGNPALRAPDQSAIERALHAAGLKSQAQGLTGMAAFVVLAGKLSSLFQSQSLNEMQANSAMRQALVVARGVRGNQLADALGQGRQAEQAAEHAASGAAGAAGEAEAAAEAARSTYERLQRELGAMDPSDQGYVAKQAEVNQALSSWNTLDGRAGAARQVAADRAAEYAAAGKVFDDTAKAIDDFNRQDPTGIAPPQAGEMLTRSARMQALIGQLSEIMADASLQKLKDESEVIMEQLRANAKSALRQAEEQEKELERSREAEKKSGCAGKIFGWISKVIAVVASVVATVVGAITMNPALVAVGVVGLALAVDSIQAEFTGFSVMGKLTEAIGSVITKALIAVGVDEKLAKSIGSIVAAIVVTAIIVVTMIAAGNVGGATQALEKAATATEKVVRVIQQIVQYAQVAGQAAGLGSSISYSAGNLVVAGIMVNVAELMARVEQLLMADDVIRELLAMVQDVAAKLMKGSQELMSQWSDMQKETDNTATAVIRHMA